MRSGRWLVHLVFLAVAAVPALLFVAAQRPGGFLTEVMYVSAAVIFGAYAGLTSLLVLLLARGPKSAAAVHGALLVSLVAYEVLMVVQMNFRTRVDPELGSKLSLTRWWLTREAGRDELHLELAANFDGGVKVLQFRAAGEGGVVLQANESPDYTEVRGGQSYQLTVLLKREQEAPPVDYRLAFTLKSGADRFDGITYGSSVPQEASERIVERRLPPPWPGPPGAVPETKRRDAATDPAIGPPPAQLVVAPGPDEIDRAIAQLRWVREDNDVGPPAVSSVPRGIEALARIGPSAIARLLASLPPERRPKPSRPGLGAGGESDDFSDNVLLAIAAIGGAEGLDALRTALHSVDSGRQFAAARALASLRDPPPEAAAEVLSLADDKNAYLRWMAVRAIPALVGSEAPLLMALRDSDPGVRRAAASALLAMAPISPAAVEALIPALADPATRLAAAKALATAKSGARAALPALKALATSERGQYAMLDLTVAVGEIDRAQVTPLLARVRDMFARERRAEAAEVLTRYGTAADFALIAADVRKTRDHSLAPALLAIEPQTPEAVAAVLALLSTPSASVHSIRLAASLEAHAQTSVPAIVKELRRKSLLAQGLGFHVAQLPGVTVLLLSALNEPGDAEATGLLLSSMTWDSRVSTLERWGRERAEHRGEAIAMLRTFQMPGAEAAALRLEQLGAN